MIPCRTTTASASLAPSGSRSAHRARLLRLGLSLGTALTPVWALAQDLPTGGTIAHGDVTISQPNDTNLSITQGSDRAIVNWDGFSIANGNRVDIAQPTADATLLNRVTGDTTSQIHGQLNANGRVFLVNPNGIFIGPTGTVNAGGFVASTLAMRNQDFILGETVFQGDGASATVENQGTVEIVTGGYAALIGGKVSNSGTIRAPLGFVGLGSGERVTLDLAGDGFLQVAIPTDSEDDGLDALIENAGTIEANGGTVHIAAATARHAARHAINLSGVVEARSVSGRNGSITLGGGSGGKVTVSGGLRTSRPAIQVTQSVRPESRPADGGTITITGQDIRLNSAAIDASGTTGGGTIHIGGEQAGGGTLPTADRLTVDTATTIRADAGSTGDGGRVILWSNLDTTFAGTISARGGTISGNGGFAEVSGKANLSYAGLADLRADSGDWGTLLLDPTDIEIVDASAGPNQLLASTIEAQLALGSVSIETSGSNATFPEAGEDGTITVDAELEWNTMSALDLIADADIIINQAINGMGDLNLRSDATISINAPLTVQSGQLGVFAGGSGLITTSATADISANTFFLGDGDWVQISADLPDFDAGNFVLGSPTSFLRALGGTGASADPYQIADVYGLQGLGSGLTTMSSFVLANDIDASGTSGWSDLDMEGAGFQPIQGFAGSLNGQRNTISNLFVNQMIGIDPGNAGLFATLDSGSVVQEMQITNAAVVGGNAGILAARNDGFVDAVGVEGSVIAADSGGGLVGDNFGSIRDSFSSGRVEDTLTNDSADVISTQLGGLVGFNAGLSGSILRSHSNALVTFSVSSEADAGGLVGFNSGTISDSYSLGTVVAADMIPNGINPTEANLGGLVGFNQGVIQRTYSSTEIRNEAAIDVVSTGGIVGLADPGTGPDGNVSGSFWDVEVSGQSATSGDGIGRTTAEMLDTDVFLSIAESEGWDFTTVWAPPGNGSYAHNYSTSPVVFYRLVNTQETEQYNGTGRYTNPGVLISGGIVEAFTFSRYKFASLDDSLTVITSDINTLIADNPNVGTTRVALDDFSLTSALGLTFGAVSNTAPLEITPAPLTISVSDQTKVYGDTFDFTGLPFTTSPLFGSDTLEALTLTSDGAIATADVNEGFAYDINATDLVGDGIDNYELTGPAGVLSVTPAPLILNVGDQTKTYGETFDLAALTILSDTLLNQDSIEEVSFASTGASATAQVAGSPYDITIDDIVGDGLDNYTITPGAGSLTINPALLTLSVADQTKVYGELFTFANTEFTPTGLVNGDTITGALLASDGAPVSAIVGDSPYAITATVSDTSINENYTITVDPGAFTVALAPLTIAALDQTKTYGTAFEFDAGDYVIVTQGPDSGGALITENGDTIDTVALSSAAAAATADVTPDEDPAVIEIGTVTGSGLENYEITRLDGAFEVDPADLTIRARNQTKVYGDTFVFTGTEFDVTGLQNADEVNSALLASDASGPVANVSTGRPILITNPDITNETNYNVSLINGTFIVTPAPLTVTANDQSKTEGNAFTFTGNEFTASELRNDDSIDSVDLFSDGADIEASADDSPFSIIVEDVLGEGLDNYDITLVPGTFTVVANTVQPPVINPPPPFVSPLPNPPDTQLTGLSGTDGDETGSVSQAGASADGSVQQAEDALGVVLTASSNFEQAAASCGSPDQDFDNFMACLSASLDTYANALDQISTELPAGLETVSAIIQEARVGVQAAATRAQGRLANATSEAERQAIRRDAVNEARASLNTAQNEIRKAITLIRAEDPDLAAVQRQTVTRVVQAFDTVDTQLVRAVEL